MNEGLLRTKGGVKMIHAEGASLQGIKCPRVKCDGILERVNKHYKCSDCFIQVLDRKDYWDKVNQEQKKTCIEVLKRAVI